MSGIKDAFKYNTKIVIEEMIGDLEEEDLEFLKNLVKKDSERMLRSPALSALLGAFNDIDRAFISELPLELALVKILGEK